MGNVSELIWGPDGIYEYISVIFSFQESRFYCDFEAALVGILPSAFKRLNRHSMPTYGLLASSVVMELFLFMVVMADDVYLAALHITGLMIIPGYLFTGLFLIRKADSMKMRIVAFVTTAFCLWMVYAGGLVEMLMTSIFYVSGVLFYLRARREANVPVFTRTEKIVFCLLFVAAIISVSLLYVNFLKA